MRDPVSSTEKRSDGLSRDRCRWTTFICQEDAGSLTEAWNPLLLRHAISSDQKKSALHPEHCKLQFRRLRRLSRGRLRLQKEREHHLEVAHEFELQLTGRSRNAGTAGRKWYERSSSDWNQTYGSCLESTAARPDRETPRKSSKNRHK